MSGFSQLMMKRFHNEANYMDLTVVGSPTISNNVVSNFSKVDYVNSNVPFNPANGVWEVGIKLTTGNTSQEAIFFRSAISAPSNAGRYGISLSIQNAQFKGALSFDGNSWVVLPRIITYIVQSNTTYSVKFGWTGSVYYMDFSLDGVTYTRVISYDSSNGIYDGLTITQFGIFSYDNRYELPWLGSIDFNSSYIKLNGVKYQFRFTMPLTKVGSPTITDGVVSGFSSSNYLRIANNVTFGNDFEICFKFTTSTLISSIHGVFNFYENTWEGDIIRIGLQITNYSTANVIFRPTVSGSYVADISNIFSDNTTYYIKYILKNNLEQVLLSTDQINWTSLIEGEQNVAFNKVSSLCIGYVNLQQTGRYFRGSIDVGNSYIIINGTKYILTLP